MENPPCAHAGHAFSYFILSWAVDMLIAFYRGENQGLDLPKVTELLRSKSWVMAWSGRPQAWAPSWSPESCCPSHWVLSPGQPLLI